MDLGFLNNAALPSRVLLICIVFICIANNNHFMIRWNDQGCKTHSSILTVTAVNDDDGSLHSSSLSLSETNNMSASQHPHRLSSRHLATSLSSPLSHLSQLHIKPLFYPHRNAALPLVAHNSVDNFVISHDHDQLVNSPPQPVNSPPHRLQSLLHNYLTRMSVPSYDQVLPNNSLMTFMENISPSSTSTRTSTGRSTGRLFTDSSLHEPLFPPRHRSLQTEDVTPTASVNPPTTIVSVDSSSALPAMPDSFPLYTNATQSLYNDIPSTNNISSPSSLSNFTDDYIEPRPFPEAVLLKIEALKVLKNFAERVKSREQFEALKSLPDKVLIGIDPQDPLSLVVCPTGQGPVSLFQCARAQSKERPIVGSCFGAAAYDPELGYCFTVSEAQPTAKCPAGYKVARFPTDKFLGSCKSTLKVPALPHCDPPYVLLPDTQSCAFNITTPGYIGCPMGSIKVPDESRCEAAVQQLKKVDCPEGWLPKLTPEGKGQCLQPRRFKGNYFGEPKCPLGTEEDIDYGNLDTNGKPLVACRTTLVVDGKASCPTATTPYYDYVVNYDNHPPVMFDQDLGSPGRTCIKKEELDVVPSCTDPLQNFVFISPGRRSDPPRYDLLLPVSDVIQQANPVWSKFTKHLSLPYLPTIHYPTVGGPKTLQELESMPTALTDHAPPVQPQLPPPPPSVPVLVDMSPTELSSSSVVVHDKSRYPHSYSRSFSKLIANDVHYNTRHLQAAEERDEEEGGGDEEDPHSLFSGPTFSVGGISGDVFYRSPGGQDIVVSCLLFKSAKPTLKCPKGLEQSRRNPSLCRQRGYTNFRLSCPSGYVLNEAKLLYEADHYDWPRPMCIGKLQAATEYYCPMSPGQSNLPTDPLASADAIGNSFDPYPIPKNREMFDSIYPSVPVYITDPTKLRCIQVQLHPPIYTPSLDIIEVLYPGYLEALREAGTRYPGAANIPDAEELSEARELIREAVQGESHQQREAAETNSPAEQ
eukprot:GHVQ01039688.1.p1 GENE.GHVQ01039688.1~~GHVQ01039688.1.p1  ORF type:complete len:981 (+),score=165.28 GHVQ01039688.1:172-3114(+)